VDCSEVQKLLPLWEVGNLSTLAEFEFIDQHLESCLACQKAMEAMPEPELPDWLVKLIPLLQEQERS